MANVKKRAKRKKYEAGIPNLTGHLQDVKDRICICEVIEALGGELLMEVHGQHMKGRIRVRCPKCLLPTAGIYCHSKRFFCDKCSFVSLDSIELVERVKRYNAIQTYKWLRENFGIPER